MSVRGLVSALAVAVATPAMAQSSLLQAGPTTPGHVPQYSSSGTMQPVIRDGGGAGGGGDGANIGEIGITAISPTGAYPSANSGNGPLGEHMCLYDAPLTSATGGHYLCLDPNAQGGGLIDYGFFGSATPLPLQFVVNGAVQQITNAPYQYTPVDGQYDQPATSATHLTIPIAATYVRICAIGGQMNFVDSSSAAPTTGSMPTVGTPLYEGSCVWESGVLVLSEFQIINAVASTGVWTAAYFK